VNENDLREALHSTLTVTRQPPPMDSMTAVAQGRRAVRRRTALAGTGATAALAAIAVLGVSIAPKFIGGGPSMLPAAAPSVAPPAVKAVPEASATPEGDATSRSGPRYAQGKLLLQRILAVVPPGYTAPTGTAGALIDGSTSEQAPLRDHQASIDGKSWSYLAYAAVAKNGGTGRLMVEVHTKGNRLPSDPCALAEAFWGMGGQCRVQTVGSAKVGVVVKPGRDKRLDQWAAYRYPDGIVVYVAQSKNPANAETSRPPLTVLPLSVPKLAALATDTRFHLG
jgi:hypothetical protein